MPRLLAFAVIATLIAAPSVAQDVPAPAAEGEGQSTQTLDLAKDAVVVTIDAGGSFSSRTGESDGGLSVDVNGSSVGLGSMPGAVESGGGEGGEPTTDSGSTATTRAPGMSSGGTAGQGLRADMTNQGMDSLSCDANLGQPMGPAAISELGAGTRVMLRPACGGAGLGEPERQAMIENPALSGYLSANNIEFADVVSITKMRDVVVLAFEADN